MNILTLIAAAGATLFFVAYLILRFSRQIRGLSDAFVRLPSSQKAVLIVSVCIATVSAQKSGTNTVEDVSGTNGTDQVEVGGGGGQSNLLSCCVGPSGLDANLLSPPPPSTSTFDLSPEDAVRGYRLESVTTNAAVSYDMPTGAAVCGTWHLTGAYEDVMRVGNGDSGLGIGFPIGNHLCESLWAFTWGKVRPQLKNASNEIAAVGAPMSALPGVSRFWTAATSNETVLLTWENFAAGRVTNAEVDSLQADGNPLPRCLSAQIELFRNGDFITRSNEVERVYCRVNPDDWDDDGIENDIDLYPYHHIDGETHFGPHQEVPEGDDEDHYCWVEIVVHQANARVTFEGEGDSWLPDPSFIAEAGATNRVMILIGKRYAVHCTMPLECVGKSEADIETWHEDGVLMIEWPVWFEYVSVGPLLMASPRLGAGNGNGGTTIRVHPNRMQGGDYSWPDNFCCYSFSAGGTPVFCCDGTCGCGGCYTGEVTYECSGHQFSFGGFSCGCGSPEEDPHGGEEEPRDPPVEGGASVNFSQSAVIFEDAYQNDPNTTVPRQSTVVELTCSAFGGPHGGTYSFEIENEEKLIRKGGSYLPRSGTLRPNEEFKIKVRYEAQEASGSVGDIKAKGRFTDAVDGAKQPVQSELTAVKVDLVTAVEAPQNACRSRHRYGVCESVYCYLTPQVAANYTVRGASASMLGGVFTCPLETTANPLEITYGGASYTPSITIQEPTAVQAHQPGWTMFSVAPLNAGGIGLEMNFVILPLDVSFRGISVEEVPSTIGSQSGYFAHPYFNNERFHSRENGAGIWSAILDGNVTSLRDCAGLRSELPRMSADMQITTDQSVGWIAGENVWSIPFGWNVAGVSGETDHHKAFAAETTQTFTIDATGTTSVEKLSNEVSREINGHVYLNGAMVW